ncbi:MAG: hypothetical protein V8R51_02130 [Clostridia bacterium]
MVKFTREQSKGMNQMVVENNKIEKICCFYESDFHLEMILVPYINAHINENIVIITENDFNETVGILVSKTNLKKENKEKILNLGWNGKKENNIEDKSIIIIIGNKKYIENKNDEIRERNNEDITIIDCYNFEDIKQNMDNIINDYSKNLNTTGFGNIEK